MGNEDELLASGHWRRETELEALEVDKIGRDIKKVVSGKPYKHICLALIDLLSEFVVQVDSDKAVSESTEELVYTLTEMLTFYVNYHKNLLSVNQRVDVSEEQIK